MLRNMPQSEDPKTRAPFRTLVVAPVSMLEQWRGEIRRWSKLDLVRLCVCLRCSFAGHGRDGLHSGWWGGGYSVDCFGSSVVYSTALLR